MSRKMSKKNVDTKKVATFRCRPEKDRKRSFLDIILDLIFNTKMIKIKYILFNKSNIIKLLMHSIFTKLVKLIVKIRNKLGLDYALTWPKKY